MQVTINGRPVSVEAGASVLDAARCLGIEIPTLCHLRGEKPITSCMICVVKDQETGRLIPSCSAPARDGMVVETDSAEVREVRRKMLDLLLSEHVGDCEAPCLTTCPARMDIPLMIRQIAAGQMNEAYETVTEMIALPAVLGRICPAPCEKACRRGQHDKPISICQLKRFVADEALKVDADLRAALDATVSTPDANRARRSRSTLSLDSTGLSTANRIAIIGAGPAGLAAAFYLARAGHACTVFDEREEPGGQLRYGVSREKLPTDVLDREIGVIRRIGVEFRMKSRIEPGAGLQLLKGEFDGIVLAPGKLADAQRLAWGVASEGRGVKVEAGTFRTSDPVVFAGGDVVYPGQMAVRAVAHGKSIACAIDQWLNGKPVVGVERPFESRLGQLHEGEVDQMMVGVDPGARVEPVGAGFTSEQAVQESRRCLRCDCRKARQCKLRDLAQEYGASQKSFRANARAEFTRIGSSVIYEPGKCIKCGICVRLSGLTFLGRGYETVVGVPFGDSLESALGSAAADCVRECPTGALAWEEA